MEGTIYFMWFDLYSYSWLYPLDVLRLFLIISVIFLQDFVQFFNIANFLLVVWSLCLDFLLQFLHSVKG